jgi:hypothetical protein
MAPLVFIINMTIGSFYFRFAKSKKWFTKIIVIIVTLVITYFAFPPVFVAYPEITSGTFPYRIVYEQNGEQHVIEDTIIAEFRGIQNNRRTWRAQQVNGNQSRIDVINLHNEISPLSNKEALRIDVFFWTGSADYFMGERNAHAWSPRISVHETFALSGGGSHMPGGKNISAEELERYFGIKIIEWNFPQPLNNSFSLW